MDASSTDYCQDLFSNPVYFSLNIYLKAVNEYLRTRIRRIVELNSKVRPEIDNYC